MADKAIRCVLLSLLLMPLLACTGCQTAAGQCTVIGCPPGRPLVPVIPRTFAPQQRVAPAPFPQSVAPSLQSTPLTPPVVYTYTDKLAERIKALEESHGKLSAGVDALAAGNADRLRELEEQIASWEKAAAAIPAPSKVEEVASKAAGLVVNAKLAKLAPAALPWLEGILVSFGFSIPLAGACAAGGPPGLAMGVVALLARWMIRRGLADLAAKKTAGTAAPQPPARDPLSTGPPGPCVDGPGQPLPAPGPQLRVFDPSAAADKVQATQTATSGGKAALPSLPVDYAKIWADHAKANGTNVAHEALRLQLYQEAMGHLRAGDLPMPAHVDGPTIADAIDHWVLTEFFRRGADKVSQDNLYHNALMGFLYRDAVDRLRRGEFSVTGAYAAADAIDDWVKREFLRRVGQPAAS